MRVGPPGTFIEPATSWLDLTPTAGTVAPFAFLVGLCPKVAPERLNSAGEAFFDEVSETARGRPRTASYSAASPSTATAASDSPVSARM
jgi:hypothetical protein